MKHRPLIRVVLALIGCIVMCCTFPGAVQAQAERPKHVLILHSYHQGFIWTDAIQDGIETALQDSDFELELYVEYMDTKRFSYEQNHEHLERLYRSRYEHHLPDVIVSSDDNALRFLLREGQELFPGVPVVFCGVDHFSEDLIAPHRHRVTGVVEGIDIKANLDLGLQLRPATKHVVVVADTSPVGEANKAAVRELAPQYEHRVDFTYLTDLTLAELQERLRKVPEDAMVLYLHFSLDSTGTYYSLEDSIGAISQASAAPVYGSWDFSVKYGVTGGYVTNGFVQGNTAAKMALRILSGAAPGDVEIVRKSPNTYMFNYVQMEPLGIDESDLPEDSIVIDKPFSFYEEYKVLIWSVVAILASLLLLIAALVGSIAKRKQVEDALREERDLVASLMETGSAGIVMVNQEGEIIFANPHAEEVLGLAKAEIAEQTYNAPEWHITDYDGGTFPDEQLPFRRVADTGQPVYDVRHGIEWPDGRRVLLSINAVPLFDESGQVNGMVATVENVTQRVQAEEALRQRTAQFEALRQVGLEITAQLNLDTLLHSIVSRAIELLQGTKGGLYLYQAERDVLEWTVAIGPQLAPVGSVLHRGEGLSGRVWETGEPFIVDDYRQWEERPTVYKEYPFVATVGVPIRWGEEFLGVLNVLADTPRAFSPADARLLDLFATQAAIAIKNARLHQELRDHAEQLEQRVQERTAELHAQYARSNAILRSTTDGIVVADQTGNIVQVNPIAQRWLTQTLSPEDAGRLQKTVQDLARQAEHMPEVVLELTGIDLGLSAAPVAEEGVQEPPVAVVDIHDVSHLKALDRMKTIFVANVSDELRQPVSTIKSYAYLMQRTPPDDARWIAYLDGLAQETERQARIVEDIMQIARLHTGRLEIAPRLTPLSELITPVITRHRSLAQEQGVTLEYQPHPPHTALDEESPEEGTGPAVSVDPRQMAPVLGYLVRDAVHYTPEGGHVLVAIGQEEAEGRTWTTVMVSDSGEAIPAEDHPHIFERFFREEEPRSMRVSETGLRLMIAKGIVELHGGRMTVESEAGRGNSFTVWLASQTPEPGTTS